MTSLEQARQKASEARERLRRLVSMVSDKPSEPIDAYSAAVKALAVAELAGEQAPELAEAEHFFRTLTPCKSTLYRDGTAIIGEVDRLRRQIDTLQDALAGREGKL